MNIRPIKNEDDYNQALAEIDKLFGAKPNTRQGDKLEILVTLVESYEEKHHPIDMPDPIEAIKYVMETRGYTREDLRNCIGTRARVSEILNKKRSLTLPMIRKLHAKFKIPARVLIRETRI